MTDKGIADKEIADKGMMHKAMANGNGGGDRGSTQQDQPVAAQLQANVTAINGSLGLPAVI